MRLIFFAVISFVVFPSIGFSQQVFFQLKSDGEAISSSSYQYTTVKDLRTETGKIGSIYHSSGNLQEVVVAGNLETQLFKLLSDRLAAPEQALYNIEVRINSLTLDESLNRKTKRYEGQVKLELNFYIQGQANPIHLVDYAGAFSYQRSGANYARVQQIFNKVFFNAMDYFHDWIIANQLNHPALAQKVKLRIIDPIRAPKSDTLFYNPSRPLRWSDFKTTPSPSSRFNASIFASFSIEGNAEIVEGELIQNVEFKLYMLPYESWVRKPSDYGLAHEQLHFDLVRVAVDRMIVKLTSMELEWEFYDAKLHTAFLDAMRELGKLQEAYDGETRHGLDTQMQAKWKDWIEKGLNADYLELEKRLK